MKSEIVPVHPGQMRISAIVTDKLIELAQQNGGHLNAEDVVEAARPKDSPLHSKFTWDNTKAAESWRYWQARYLINVSVNIVSIGSGDRSMRTFVNLKSDRKGKTGYRIMADVLSSTSLRNQLLEESLDQMSYFRQKYATLKELTGVFQSIRKVERKFKKGDRK